MQRKDLNNFDLPDKPGVYTFLEKKKILYIGKATSLRDRVRSYFNDDVISSRGPRIVDMVTKADEVLYEETDSVLEALILESLKIKKHQPFYNVKEKDDKSYLYAVVTKEEWPRVLAVRGKDLGTTFKLDLVKNKYGPFTSGPSLKKALDIIRKIFPFYDTKNAVTRESKHQGAHLEFNRQIGRYPRDVSHTEYVRNIRHIELFLSGKKKIILKELEKEMKKAAKEERFEDAQRHKRQMFSLTHIQDVSLIKNDLRRVHGVRVEGYDVAHTSGQDTVGVMTIVVDGEVEKKNYRKFLIKEHGNNDVGSLTELLERRFGHPEWEYPKVIVVDGGVAQKNAALKVLDRLGLQIPVVAVTKDEYHRPKKIIGLPGVSTPEGDIILANAEAHRYSISFHRSRRDNLKR
tara:strand:- start:216742 stop:217953 length:1212 start_codon:yes stop_codon:yes gene_type:complete